MVDTTAVIVAEMLGFYDCCDAAPPDVLKAWADRLAALSASGVDEVAGWEIYRKGSSLIIHNHGSDDGCEVDDLDGSAQAEVLRQLAANAQPPGSITGWRLEGSVKIFATSVESVFSPPLEFVRYDDYRALAAAPKPGDRTPWLVDARMVQDAECLCPFDVPKGSPRWQWMADHINASLAAAAAADPKPNDAVATIRWTHELDRKVGLLPQDQRFPDWAVAEVVRRMGNSASTGQSIMQQAALLNAAVPKVGASALDSYPAGLSSNPAPKASEAVTYSSTQATDCAGCGKYKHTPLRIDAMGGYVCLTCIDQKLGSLLGEFGYEQADPTPLTQPESAAVCKAANGMADPAPSVDGAIENDLLLYGTAYEVDGMRVHPGRIRIHTRQADPAPPAVDDGARVLTCVYCGQEYPQGTAAWGESVLTEHIAACPKHPMRGVIADNARLRAALAGIVGESDPGALRKMASLIATLPGEDADKAATINAINALLPAP